MVFSIKIWNPNKKDISLLYLRNTQAYVINNKIKGIMKDSIINELKENGYVVDAAYSKEKWQDIANELREEVYFDDTWGIAFTKSYANKYLEIVKPKKGGKQ